MDNKTNNYNSNNNNINLHFYNYLSNINENNSNKNRSFSNLINNSGSRSELNIFNKSTDLEQNNYIKSKKKEKKKIYSKMTCFNEVIVQKYLDNPLLYKKRKFIRSENSILDAMFSLIVISMFSFAEKDILKAVVNFMILIIQINLFI